MPAEPRGSTPSRTGNGQLWGLFDVPIYKDWTLYLAALGILGSLVALLPSYWETNPFTGELEYVGPTAGLVADLAFAVPFQFCLFGVLPAAIRRVVRGRRNRSAEVAQVGHTSPRRTSAPDPVTRGAAKNRGDLDQAYNPEPPETIQAPSSSVAESLRELASLHDEGIVTDDKFKKKKARLLDKF